MTKFEIAEELHKIILALEHHYPSIAGRSIALRMEHEETGAKIWNNIAQDIDCITRMLKKIKREFP